jgi:hypothetical protein
MEGSPLAVDPSCEPELLCISALSSDSSFGWSEGAHIFLCFILRLLANHVFSMRLVLRL